MKKKHPCPDCHECHWCGDERCRLCLKEQCCRRRKLSMAEQIAFFERINQKQGESGGSNG